MLMQREHDIKHVNVPTIEDAKKYIESMDLSCIIERMVSNEGWLRSQAVRAINQYKKFLLLTKKYGNKFNIAPSEDIDEVWHNHILFTRKYTDDCQRIYGRFLHHQPEPSLQKNLRIHEHQDREFNMVLELYYREFGEPLESVRFIWPINKVLLLIGRLRFFFHG